MTIEGSSTLVFCPPPLGKPDPKLPKPRFGPDNRPRVIQTKMQGSTCWYSVFNRIRERYKAPNIPQTFTARKIERMASKWKKSINGIDHTMLTVINNPAVKKAFSTFTKEIARERGALIYLETVHPKLLATIPSFLTQTEHTNLYDHLCAQELNKRMEISLTFFSELGNLMGKELTSFMATYQKMSHGALECSLRATCAMNYMLEISSWHPRQPITDLIKELKENGPLAVSGYYGALQYNGPPKKLARKIHGRELYCWSKEDRQSGADILAHTILLVGAEVIKGKGFAYYIDPNDESDPDHPEKERIFAVSYDTLTSPSIISSNRGVIGHEVSEYGYAYYKKKNGHSRQ